jgi:hypothetical protein
MDFSVSFRHASERGGLVLYLRNAIPTCNIHYRSSENFFFLLSERCEPREQDVLVSLTRDTIMCKQGPRCRGLSGFSETMRQLQLQNSSATENTRSLFARGLAPEE